MLEAIKTLVAHYTTIEHPYKVGMEDWMDNAKLHRHIEQKNGIVTIDYWVQTPWTGFQTFVTIEEAVHAFCSLAYSKYNLANAFQGVYRYNLTSKYLDDLEKSEVERLIKLYQDEYHAKDFPFFAEQFNDELILKEVQWSKEGREQEELEEGPVIED